MERYGLLRKPSRAAGACNGAHTEWHFNHTFLRVKNIICALARLLARIAYVPPTASWHPQYGTLGNCLVPYPLCHLELQLWHFRQIIEI